MKIEILFPVLNEEIRLEKGITRTIEYLSKKNLKAYEWELTIVDNGSTDKTSEISKRLCAQYSCVHYIKTNQKGVGLAFREGVKNTKSDIVGYMDIDLSTDLKHLLQMAEEFQKNKKIGIVNASRWKKGACTRGRKWYRNVTSHGLTIILKIFLKMKCTDSICGFKFFRREVVRSLMKEASEENGWFYLIELLIRAEKHHIYIKEIPVKWTEDDNSKVKMLKTITNYLTQIFKLRKTLKQEKLL